MGMDLSHIMSDLTGDIRISVSHLDHSTFLSVLLMLSSNILASGLVAHGATAVLAEHTIYVFLATVPSSLMSGCTEAD